MPKKIPVPGNKSTATGAREKAVLRKDIGALRREAKVSQRKASAAIGIDYNTYIRVEAGGGVSLAGALKIAHFLKMPVEEIWGLKEDRE